MAGRRRLLLLVVIALLASMAASGAATTTVDVKDYGAKGNGVDDDTEVRWIGTAAFFHRPPPAGRSPIHQCILYLMSEP
jgi:hypothetical protein